jgi:class 3 adenylate cyclase/tetratricopeptide (TPR) repeat protein
MDHHGRHVTLARRAMPTILFLAADPSDTARLALDREARGISHALEAAPQGSAFQVAWEWAVRADEIEACLRRHQPTIVHFSGHGDGAGHLLVEDESGRAAPLDGAALARVLALLNGSVRCVVLNACFSAPLAEALSPCVDRVVGMTADLGDRAAVAWSSAFYAALGAGETVDRAFEWARAQLALLGLGGAAGPELVCRAGAAPVPPFTPPPRPVAPAGENRVCTALLVDLSDSAGILAHLDPEVLRDVLSAATAAVRQGAEALGGAFAGADGQRVWALFGAPRATDADAERAVRAALGIQAALARRELPRAAGAARLSARIGIGTGRSFVDAPAGPEGGLRAVGEPAIEAERLARAAAPGAILVEFDTVRQVAGLFELEPLGALGGSATPTAPGASATPAAPGASVTPAAPAEDRLPAYRVLGPAAVRYRLAPADFHGIETAFVGRAGLRQGLVEALETVLAESRPRLLTVVGAAGVGRSRLVADLFVTLTQRPESFVVLTAQCSRLQESSYGLAAALIRRRFAIQESDDADRVRHKLRRGVRWLRGRLRRAPLRPGMEASAAGLSIEGAELDDALGQVAAILGVAPAGAAPAVRDDVSSLAKGRIAAAVARLLGPVAARLPVVVLCDDIHWADAPSLDLLDEIVARGADLPVLVVCSARPDLDDRRPHWGEGVAAHQRLEVGPLERRFLEAMIKDRLRLAAAIPDALVRVVADLAEGNPLTAVETLHLLVEAGVVEIPAAGSWVVHEDRLGALALPATVQGIIEARLDRLDPSAHDALTRASVVGQAFWEGVVDSLRQQGGAPGGATADLLALLRDRQLVHAREVSTLPVEREYVFAEAATREVAYDMLSGKSRAALHRLVAAWLEARAPGPAGAAALALHYDRGGDPARAAAAYARAAAYAAPFGENAEALAALDRAAALHDQAVDPAAGPRRAAALQDQAVDPAAGPRRAAALHDQAVDPAAGPRAGPEDRRVAAWPDRVQLRLDRSDILRRLGCLDEAARACDEARALVREAALRTERRAQYPTDTPERQPWEARIDYCASLAAALSGALPEALALVERALAGARAAGALAETPPMIADRVFLLRRLLRADEAYAAAREGLRACRGRADPRVPRGPRWPEDFARLLFSLAVALYARRRWVGAERSYRWARRALDEQKSPELAARAVNGIAAALYARGDLAGARDQFRQALRLKDRLGDQHQLAAAYSNLAEVELALGDGAAALDHARRAVAIGERMRAGYDLADMYRNLAQASLAAGDLGGALSAGEKALAAAEVTSKNYLGDAAMALAGICVRAAADPDPAVQARAAAAASTLRAALDRSFGAGDLVAKATECRALLAGIPTP